MAITRSIAPGIWQGAFRQAFGPDGKPAVIHVRLLFAEGTFGGAFELRDSTPIELLPATGRWANIHGTYFKLDHVVHLDGVDQHGASVVELQPDGRLLIGRFVAYGARTMAVVHGEVALEKVAP